MILKRLAGKNFRQYQSLDYTFPLAGTIAIIGENESGKSTLQEMIGYALFGHKVFRTVKEKVLNFKADKSDECSVELEFILNEKTYKIIRGFKGKNTFAKFEEAGVDGSRCDGAKAVDEEIKKLFGGIGWETFSKTYYVKQNELSVLSSMIASERKQFVLKMLHIDSIDKVLEEIRSEIKTIKTKLESIDSESFNVAELEDQIKDLNKDIDDWASQIKKNDEDIQSKKGDIKTLNGDYELKNKDLNDIVSKLSNMELQLKNLNQNLEEKESEKKKVAESIKEITKLNNEKKNLDELEEEYDRLKKLFDKKEQIDKDKKELIKVKGKKQEYEEKLEQLNIKLDKYNEELPELETNITEDELNGLEAKLERTKEKNSEFKTNIKTEESKIEKYKKCIKIIVESDEGTVKCPFCNTDISDKKHFEKDIIESQELISGYIEKIKELSDIIEKASKKININREKINNSKQLKTKIESLKEQTKECKSSLRGINENIEILEEKIPNETIEVSKEQLDALKKQVDHEKEIRIKLKNGPELSKKFKGLQGAIAELEEQIENLVKDKRKIEKEKSVEDLKKNVEDVKKTIERTNEELEQLRNNNDQVKVKKAGKEADAKNVNDNLDKAKQNREKHKMLENDLLKHNKLLNYFNDFKIQLIAQITPRLSEMLSSFIASSTSNRYTMAELDNDYNIFVNIDGEMQPIEVLSGGATDLFNACLRFSISRYLNESTGSFMRMMFLDEIFASQSTTRRANLLSVIDTLKSAYSQIFVITHVNDVVDYVDRVINVEIDPVKGSYLS